MPDVLTEKLPSGVMIVTFNRPDALNTLGGTLLEDFGAAMDEARRDGNVRAVLVTGAGRAFCAGADLSARGGSSQNGTISNLGPGLTLDNQSATSRTARALAT